MKDLIKNAVRYLAPAILLTSALVGCGGVDQGYSVGGTLTGLAVDAQVTLSNNGGDPIVVTGNGSFKFAKAVLPYSVTVTQQPNGQVCTISGGSGTASAAVTNVSVACTSVTLLSCGPGQVANGIAGRGGFIIDKLQLRCANVVASLVDTSTTVDGDFVGGDGGTAFTSFTCPSGEWISGVSGTNGRGGFETAMRSVQVTCSGGSQSPVYNDALFSLSPYSFSCQAGQRAKGFVIGTAGGYSGFMQGITCESPAV
jgi:hypothetical protein